MKLRIGDGARVGTYRVGTAPFAIAFAGEDAWVTNFYDGSVTKLRASDGTVIGTYAVGDGAADVVFDGTNVWTANSGADTVTALRPSDGQVVATVAVGRKPFGLEVTSVLGIKRVWVTSFGSNTVSVIDPRRVI
jgi:YVTN family beta-propeller protein